MPNKQLIQRLREAFNLPEDMVSDEKLLICTKDTLTRAGVGFNMACEPIIEVLKEEFKRVAAKMSVNYISGRID